MMDLPADEKIRSMMGRRSIRTYDDRVIDEASIETILQVAMAAPSACAKDPWRFIVVRDKRTLARIADGLPNGKMLVAASVGIVVCGDIVEAHDCQESYLLQDCSAAIENILLGATALGIGTCWLGVHPRPDRIEHVRRVLQIPSTIIPVACVSCGYPAEIRPPRTRFRSEHVHHETW